MVFFPIIPLAVAMGYFVFWIFVAIYVFSVQGAHDDMLGFSDLFFHTWPVLKPDQNIPSVLQPYTGAK
ncbi:hypothetical protein BVRB_035920, partial [Beta vulgaris subsp. vulgaris]